MTAEAASRSRARRNLRREILSARLRVTLDQKENKSTPRDIELLASLNLPDSQATPDPEPSDPDSFVRWMGTMRDPGLLPDDLTERLTQAVKRSLQSVEVEVKQAPEHSVGSPRHRERA